MGRVRMAYGDWSLNGIEGVIFDKDGTLIDVHPYWGRVAKRRVDALMKRYDLAESHRAPLAAAIGLNIETRRLLPGGPIGISAREVVLESTRHYLQSVDAPATTDEIEEIFAAEHVAFGEEMLKYTEVLPGVRGILGALRSAKIALALITADTDENAHRFLAHLGLNGTFDTVLGRDQSQGPKTSGKVARLALAQMGVSPKHTVAVGDAPPDATMAENASLVGAVLVATGQSSIETLAALSPYTAPGLMAIDIKEEETT